MYRIYHALKGTALAAIFLFASVGLAAQEDLFELLQTGSSEQQLWSAAEELSVADVEQHLEQGGDPDLAHEFGGTALMFVSAYNENPAVIEALLDGGADVNATDSNGLTALMVASLLNSNPQVITTLLDAGADPSAHSKDRKAAADYAAENHALQETEVYEELRSEAE